MNIAGQLTKIKLGLIFMIELYIYHVDFEHKDFACPDKTWGQAKSLCLQIQNLVAINKILFKYNIFDMGIFHTIGFP